MAGIDDFTPETWAAIGSYIDSQKTIEQLVREKYPQLAWVLNNPEVGPILKQAAKENWDTARLQGALQKTNWWKTTDAAQREWQRIWAEDPASGGQKFNDTNLVVSNIANRLGVKLAQGTLMALTTNAAAEGWDQVRITQEVMRNAVFDPNGTGDINGIVNQLKDRAADYLMAMGDEAAFGWAKNILTGQASKDGYDAYLRGQALKRFAGDETITAALNQGATLKEIFDPYIQQTAGLLEISPDQVNLMDGKWSSMIDSVGPDGKRRPMTLSEAGVYVRGLNEWRATQQAGQSAAGIGETLLKAFGEVA